MNSSIFSVSLTITDSRKKRKTKASFIVFQISMKNSHAQFRFESITNHGLKGISRKSAFHLKVPNFPPYIFVILWQAFLNAALLKAPREHKECHGRLPRVDAIVSRRLGSNYTAY